MTIIKPFCRQKLSGIRSFFGFLQVARQVSSIFFLTKIFKDLYYLPCSVVQFLSGGTSPKAGTKRWGYSSLSNGLCPPPLRTSQRTAKEENPAKEAIKRIGVRVEGFIASLLT
jgi:hypothetical protein